MFRRNKFKFLLLAGALAIIVAYPLAAWAVNYQVQPGDTLWTIAQRFGISLRSVICASIKGEKPPATPAGAAGGLL